MKQKEADRHLQVAISRALDGSAYIDCIAPKCFMDSGTDVDRWNAIQFCTMRTSYPGSFSINAHVAIAHGNLTNLFADSLANAGIDKLGFLGKTPFYVGVTHLCLTDDPLDLVIDDGTDIALLALHAKTWIEKIRSLIYEHLDEGDVYTRFTASRRPREAASLITYYGFLIAYHVFSGDRRAARTLGQAYLEECTTNRWRAPELRFAEAFLNMVK